MGGLGGVGEVYVGGLEVWTKEVGGGEVRLGEGENVVAGA